MRKVYFWDLEILNLFKFEFRLGYSINEKFYLLVSKFFKINI